SNLVPDGLTSVLVVGAVLAGSVGVTSSTRRARVWWLAVAVACVVVASLTKQTGAVGLLILAIVVWNGLARPPRWMVLTALALEAVVVFVAGVVANGAPDAVADLPGGFVADLRGEVFPGSPAVVVAAAIALFLVAWALPRATQPLVLAGLTVTASAVALGLYAGGSGLQMRNAATLPYGVSLLLG